MKEKHTLALVPRQMQAGWAQGQTDST